ncbi:MAG: hypothetical protein AB1938_24020 [Myxococcota bacterium]
MLLLLVLAAAPSLPDTVELKTPTESFTATHFLALRDGRLWWKRRDLASSSWALLPPDGLPAPRGRLEALKELTSDLPVAPPPFRRPARLVSLSADGDNLVAVSEAQVVYYTKLSTLDWTDRWGPPALNGHLSAAGVDALAMSHRKIPYEDLDGNPHPVSAGVTTLYALKDGGRVLAFADPWLPPDFQRTLCLPERGRFVAASLSASASTVFVMDAAGRAFTRLVDFDTLGDDPALPYSYAREKRSGPKSVVRTLPAEDWRAQPRVPGPHTTRITIHQTGSTNADRELRVEGDGGTWVKRLFDAEWRFVSTGRTAAGPALVSTPPQQPSRDETLTAANPWAGAVIRLEQFNPGCPPARLVVEAPGEDLSLDFPFHGGLDLDALDRDKGVRHFKGALLLPKGKSPWLHRLRAAAAGASHLEVSLEVTATDVRLSRPPLPELRFPRR